MENNSEVSVVSREIRRYNKVLWCYNLSPGVRTKIEFCIRVNIRELNKVSNIGESYFIYF